MVKCPACGEENPPKFRLCGYCGAPLAAAAAAALPAHEVRKTVTLIFSDLKDSTVLGERLDSEALHEVKERYFAAMAAEIRRHGGKIEKYIGDAIMAVFGLPRANEDDALRAVRAAVGMRTALTELNADAAGALRRDARRAHRREHRRGGRARRPDGRPEARDRRCGERHCAARAGGTRERDLHRRGDLPAGARRGRGRGGRAADAQGQVAAGACLSADQRAGPVRQRAARRHAGCRPRCRTRGVAGVMGCGHWYAPCAAGDGDRRRRRRQVAPGARTDEPRRRPRDASCSAAVWRTAKASRSGRCARSSSRRPTSSATTPRKRRGPRCSRSSAKKRSQTDWPRRPDSAPKQFPLHEINWGARRLMQRLAVDGPVLAMIDDIHWAEPAFLDLLENLLDTVENAAVLVVATARHDLLEARPEWGERESSKRLVLQPLSDEAATQVVSNLLGAAGLPDALVKRIVDAAEGNPLYVEQMLSMLIDSGAVGPDGAAAAGAKGVTDIDVPPTIHALLEARLDKLERTERATAEPASVIGMEFPRSALQSLAPQQLHDKLDAQLQALTRKRFIRPFDATEADRALPLRSPPGARHRLQRSAQARARDDARRVRQVGRPGQRRKRSRPGVRGDPRLPPRAGVQVPRRTRARSTRRERRSAAMVRDDLRARVAGRSAVAICMLLRTCFREQRSSCSIRRMQHELQLLDRLGRSARSKLGRFRRSATRRSMRPCKSHGRARTGNQRIAASARLLRHARAPLGGDDQADSERGKR